MSHRSLLSSLTFANFENSDPFDRIWTPHHLRFRERAAGIVVAALPVLFHHSSGKEEVLGDALVASGTIDEVDNITDLLVRFLLQHCCVLTFAKFIGNLLQEIGERDTKLLCLLVVIRCCAGSA